MEQQSYLYQNHWSIIGVLVSLVGLVIAIYQIKRIRKTTEAISETYRTAIRAIENREVISIISNLLQRVESLKLKIREGRGSEMASDLSMIAKLIVGLQGWLTANGQGVDLLPFRDLCNELEVRTLSPDVNVLGRSALSSQFLELSRLEQLLTEVQSSVKYGRELETQTAS